MKWENEPKIIIEKDIILKRKYIYVNNKEEIFL
jgi:hypothetical protein